MIKYYNYSLLLNFTNIKTEAKTSSFFDFIKLTILTLFVSV